MPTAVKYSKGEVILLYLIRRLSSKNILEKNIKKCLTFPF